MEILVTICFSRRLTSIGALLTASVVSLSAHAGPATITLATTVRDFTPSTNPDFERYLGDDREIVQSTLGADNKPLYNSANSNPSITSGADFDQWYHDAPGHNVTLSRSITLSETSPGSGTYQYANSSYFPIDGAGFGNYGVSGHNFHFTTEIHTLFTYQTGQNFSFTGDDDVFVFINKLLVIDLGGVHGAESAAVNLDTLGLTVGSDYQLDVFQAERHTTESNFKMTTSIQLRDPTPAPEPGTLASAALALLVLGWSRRRTARSGWRH